MRRSEPRPSDPAGFVPTLLRQRPSQREAVRRANGARPDVELATAIAQLVACLVPALSLFAIAVRGCL